MPEISLWPDPGIVKRAFLGDGCFLIGWAHSSRPGFIGMKPALLSVDMMDLRFRHALFFGEPKP